MKMMVVNLFWRESGYPGLFQSETWRTAECSKEQLQPTMRAMVSQLRRTVCGLHSVRVRTFERPPKLSTRNAS